MTSTTPSILLVESSQASIDIFLRLFENDFEVSITNTGKACLAFIAETSPDVLIISDQLDDISSLQVCNKIRESGEIKSLFIHLITENNNPANLLAAYKAGYDEFIVKPQNFDEGHWLPPKIGKLLQRDNSHLVRHNSSYQEDTPIEIRQSIGEASLDVLCSHNLIATLMIYGNHEPVFMSSYGETYDLDKSILRDCREKARIIECDNRIIYYGNQCAIGVRNMPTNDADKRDQLNNYLAAMLTSMDAGLMAIAAEGNILEKQTSILKKIADTRSTLTMLDATNKRQQHDHAAMLSDLGENLETALFDLGLTDEQEEFLASILEETRVIGDALYKTADDLDAQLQLIISNLTDYGPNPAIS